MKKIAFTLLLCFCSISIFSSDLKKGTVVTLADGIEISIEEVRKGDLLLTLNPKSNNIQVSRVENIKTSSQALLKKITLANGHEVSLSEELPILTSEGWASADDIKTKSRNKYSTESIKKYKVDSFVYTINEKFNIGIVPIIEIVEEKGNFETYTLDLDNKDAAFIANGIFVGQE